MDIFQNDKVVFLTSSNNKYRQNVYSLCSLKHALRVFCCFSILLPPEQVEAGERDNRGGSSVFTQPPAV